MPKARRQLMFKFIAVLISTFLSCAVAEFAVRASLPHKDLWTWTGRAPGKNPMGDWAQVDAFSAYKAKPGAYKDMGKSVNSHGFISTPELSLEKPDDTLRIVFLGGSSTAGTGKILSDEETWPWKVTQRLQAT
ncbi:MAG: hypothetical protein HN348_27900, partial [Proteobacteria bacterium]|nr:hypothetical protein [Pseudomonadota bacterium]